MASTGDKRPVSAGNMCDFADRLTVIEDVPFTQSGQNGTIQNATDYMVLFVYCNFSTYPAVFTVLPSKTETRRFFALSSGANYNFAMNSDGSFTTQQMVVEVRGIRSGGA